MITCPHDCEFCDLLASCHQVSAVEYKSQAAVEGHAQEKGGVVPEGKSQAAVESCFYVPILGPLTDTPVGYLRNVRRFCDVASRLMAAGYCPLNPAADLLEILVHPELTVDVVQRRTRQMIQLAALAPVGRRAALCLGLRNAEGESSTGSLGEMDLCGELGIPVCWSEEELARLRGPEP
jgi:hypothetical protein